ncbi:MAG: PD-(D/E)XK nuclease family protein [Planctomycetales bacterium]|nr:PD-(D/E)XK nuclease family protein [Planctomycetales bacterium]
MPISRKFLDWTAPALVGAAEYVIERYRDGQQLNLDAVLMVVPGSRAGRRLLEIVVERADREGLVLTPPQIETIGRLPEQLYEPKRPFATDFVQQLAWIHALRTAGRGRVIRVIRDLPEDADIVRWMALARLLWNAHRELAAEGLDFSRVMNSSWLPGELEEKTRWRVMRRIQELYLKVLDHFQLWDMQTARLFAIEHGECHTEKDIIVVAAADMPVAVRQMLDQVSERVTTLTYAPESMADRFDEYGCIVPEKWEDAEIPIEDSWVRVVEGAAEQAETVAETIAAWDGWRRADEITIGVPEESLVPQIHRQLAQCGVPSRWAVGKRLPETSPYRLMRAIADYLDRGRYVDFAALVRHPAMFDWLVYHGAPAGWLTELDIYYGEHVQPKLGQWLGPPEACEAARQAWELVESLLQPLRGGVRKLGHWSQPIIDVLVNIHDHIEMDRNDPSQHYVLAACRQIQSVLLAQHSAPQKLMPSIESHQALRLALQELGKQEIAPLPDPEAVEMLGWLELPLDTAEVLIVTSFNDGLVPTSINADLFLPNALRRRIGLLDNYRRYARDAYALSVLAATRESLTLIVGRYDTEGNPLSPSRLLFTTSDDDVLAARAIKFFEPEPKRPMSAPAPGAPISTGLCVPRPPEVPPAVESMTVTAFRDYLACPYRFYLRHVLKLRTLDDRAEELNAAVFGSLLHEVLRRFGEGDARHSSDADEIKYALRDSLASSLAEQFGDERLAPVTVQLYQLRSRLDAFARWQADWARQGWRIEHIEQPESGKPIWLEVDGEQSMRLRGRIDRIDRHQDTGAWTIFDYKTSDRGKSPEEAHQRGGEWTDLQLPLYRHLAEPMGVSGEIQLGYLVLPKDLKQIGHRLARWTPADLAGADETARQVVRDVLRGRFWPPREVPPDWDDFAAVCMQGVFDAPALEADE